MAVSSNLILEVRDPALKARIINRYRFFARVVGLFSCAPLIAGTVDNYSANVTGFGLFLLNNDNCKMQSTLCLCHYESVKTSTEDVM